MSAGTAASATAAESLRAGLETFIAAEAGHPAAIRALWRLPGGTMREAWALDVEIAGGAWAGAHRLILMADCGAQILYSRLPREDELRVIAAMHASGVPSPRPYWCIPEGRPHGLPPGLLMERVEGETVARRLLADAAYAAVRPRLLEQMAEALARMHAVPAAALDGLPGPATGQAPVQFQLREVEAALRALGEPHPALELGLRWLGRRIPARERLVPVHGDYRLGNVVVDPGAGLRAVLDWELTHLGDPGEDVGWACMRFWRSIDRPGAPALGSRERFRAAYAAAGGRRFDPEAAHYWDIFANVRWAVITLAQAFRHLSGRERSLELASIGRHCAEVEYELMRLLREH